MRIHRLARLMLPVALCLSIAFPAKAFKVGTHVFIAQQLLIDLEKTATLQFVVDGILETATVPPHSKPFDMTKPAFAHQPSETITLFCAGLSL